MDFLANYFGSLNPMSFLSALPGNIAQGIIWGLMGLGVFLTFKLLNFADLSVDGSFATGGAVTAVMLINGCPVWATIIVAILAGLAAGLVTGLLHTLLGIPDILAGILTQIALYSINLNIMGKSNLPISYRNYTLVVSAKQYKYGNSRRSWNLCRCNCRNVLVFRHGTGFNNPFNRFKPCNEQGTGH